MFVRWRGDVGCGLCPCRGCVRLRAGNARAAGDQRPAGACDRVVQRSAGWGPATGCRDGSRRRLPSRSGSRRGHRSATTSSPAWRGRWLGPVAWPRAGGFVQAAVDADLGQVQAQDAVGRPRSPRRRGRRTPRQRPTRRADVEAWSRWRSTAVPPHPTSIRSPTAAGSRGSSLGQRSGGGGNRADGCRAAVRAAAVRPLPTPLQGPRRPGVRLRDPELQAAFGERACREPTVRLELEMPATHRGRRFPRRRCAKYSTARIPRARRRRQ